MKQTDTFKYELLLRLCDDEAADKNETLELVPEDILPHYGARDTQAERKQAAHFFSAVQSLESLRIVRMEKSRRDGATYVDKIVLEDPEAAAAELAKYERRLEQEAREAAYKARQAQEAEEDEASEAEVSEVYGTLEEAEAQGAESLSDKEAASGAAASANGGTRSRRGRGRRSSGPVDPRITREACEYLEEVDAPLTPRELSLLVTGDTKKIDKTGLKRLASTLRRKNAASSNQGALTDAGVIADLKTICIKGPIVLITDRGAIDASILPNGLSMFDVDLPNIDRSYVRAKRIITVENLDAYRRCNGEDVYIYTEGSVSPRHRALLRMIHEQNPQVEFAHFGDIDYAGIKAHRVIEETLGCEVGMFHMGIAELANPSYRKAIHPLTSKDRDLLTRLLEYERYRGLVSYMLERNVKLEQEIVALDLFSDYDVDAAMALPEGRGAGEESKESSPAPAPRERARRSSEGTYRRQARQRAVTATPSVPAEKNAPSHPEAPQSSQEAPAAQSPSTSEAEKRPRKRTRKPRAKAAVQPEAQVQEVSAQPAEASAVSEVVMPEPGVQDTPEAKATPHAKSPRGAKSKAKSGSTQAAKPESKQETKSESTRETKPKGSQETEAAPEAAPKAKAKASRSQRQEMQQQRKELLSNVAAGKVSALDLMDAVDDLARSIPVVHLLAALPGWNEERAKTFMEQESISSGRTLRGLGKRQRARVREAIKEGA